MNSQPPPVARGAGQTRRLNCRRSRNGCLTCKRRKVRCNERKPHCYHCQRLNLECVWKEAGSQKHRSSSSNNAAATGHAPDANVAAAPPLSVNEPSPSTNLFGFAQSVAGPTEDLSLFPNIYLPDFGDLTAPPSRHTLHEPELSIDLDTSNLPLASPQSPVANVDVDIEDPLQLHVPPILDPVENGPKGASVRALLDSMATSSPMVRYSIAAFEAIQFPTGRRVDYRQYYDKAANQLSERFHKSGGDMISNNNELRYVLATIFFLTYINFLTGRLDLAYSNLEKAHNALHTSGRGALGSLEQRIISWIRLSDARAASAGGEGLLVNDTSGIYLSTPSPSSPSTEQGHDANSATNPSSHEVIYDMLCQPGIAFFQEVQTITGRITRIAHYHRSRGTVEDETEVMAIAADILRDLSSLYDRRPALMDHAVSGNISDGTLAQPLASAIVHSSLTYLANFYACYIHLHRVAHRHLARSKAVVTALCNIKKMMHSMVDNNDSIPVNMLWPLFLLGCEEDDYDECQWILETIRSLQHVVTNANMTADVLQETQRRQREAGTRVDTRSVCLELFNSTFAIV